MDKGPVEHAGRAARRVELEPQAEHEAVAEHMEGLQLQLTLPVVEVAGQRLVEAPGDELEELAGKIKEYLEILGSRERIMNIIADELREVQSQEPLIHVFVDAQAVPEVIAGWTEMLKLMTEGQKVRVWIPEELAYRGRPGAPSLFRRRRPKPGGSWRRLIGGAIPRTWRGRFGVNPRSARVHPRC